VIQPAHLVLAVAALRERADRCRFEAWTWANSERVRADYLLDLARECTRAADEIQREITQ
jgi:hypothetical protein